MGSTIFVLLVLSTCVNYRENVRRSVDVPILHKSIGLPDSEMDRGQEHANKVQACSKDYDPVQDNHICTTHLDLQEIADTVYSMNRYDETLKGSGQSPYNGTVKTELNESNEPCTKYENAHKRTTIGLPKGGNTYGNGVSILLSQNQFRCEQKGIQNIRTYKTAAASRTLSDYESGTEFISQMKRENSGRYTRLYKLICSKELLTLAYNKIKSNPGNMTPGSDGSTLDGMSIRILEQLSGELEKETFKFTSVKRVYIPKKNGEMRPLGIPNIKDKIVQKSMLLVLELIYEPLFSDVSFGFRPNRSTHSALREISH